MRNIKRLNEELSRWAFEILFKQNQAWKIAFTNPTAGPWKTIKGVSLQTGREGEVYRFSLEEDRPDIIMYNDQLRKIIIFEAKDDLAKLLETNQATKSAQVVADLGKILVDRVANPFWRGRETYDVILGLLWGSVDNPSSTQDKNRLFDCYRDLVAGKEHVEHDIIIGIETLYQNDELTCKCFYKTYGNYSRDDAEQISASLIIRGQ